MNKNFDFAFSFILRWEGGYVNDPNDPGGETKFGISKRSYPQLDIKNLTEEQAKTIYRRDFWERCGCHEMPWPMDVVVFDTAVNCGPARALRWFKQAQNWQDLLMARIQHYTSLALDPNRRKFLLGWVRRVVDLWESIKLKGVTE